MAVDDPRSEGDRVAVLQHTVISADPTYNGTLVRNVEAKIYDNDTPGVFVTQIAPGSTVEDGQTIVVEGSNDPAVGGLYTGTDDELLVQLAKAPDPGQIVVVRLSMDAVSQQGIQLSNLTADPRFHKVVVGSSTYYTITFNDPANGLGANDWQTPVRVHVNARDDAKREDPQIATIQFVCDDTSLGSCGDIATHPTASFEFPNLRSGPGNTYVEVIDNETAGVVTIPSGTDTVVVKCGNALCTVPGPTDDYTLRLTKRPQADSDPAHAITPVTVQIAVLTDGLVDVQSINGTAINFQNLSDPNVKEIGGYVGSQQFQGNLIFGTTAGKTTLTRANGSDLGELPRRGLRRRAVHPDRQRRRRVQRPVLRLDRHRHRPDADDARRRGLGRGEGRDDDQPPHASGQVGGRRQGRDRRRRPQTRPYRQLRLACRRLHRGPARQGLRQRVALRQLQDPDRPRRQRDVGQQDRVHE